MSTPPRPPEPSSPRYRPTRTSGSTPSVASGPNSPANPVTGGTPALGAQPWLDAFDARIGLLSSNGRSWLGPLRRKAIGHVAERGFPGQREEDWRHTPLRALLAQRFTPAKSTVMSAEAVARLEELSLDGVGAHRLVFVNGALNAEHTRIGEPPEGVRLMSLAKAIDTESALVEPHLARLALSEDHAFIALNTAFMVDGAFIHLPKGAQIEAPIHIVHLQIVDDFNGDGGSVDDSRSRGAGGEVDPDLAGGVGVSVDGSVVGGRDGDVVVLPAIFPRTLIVAGAGSSVHVIETYAGIDGGAYLTSAVTETVVGEGADVRWTKRQEEATGGYHIGRFNGRQIGPSTLATHNIALGGRLVRNEFAIVVDAENCETLLDGLYMARGSQHIENRTRLDHAKPNCHSEEHYKGILDDHSTAVFAGRIYVHQDAQKTDAFQENSCLLLSRDARVFTQPQLEIFADDVKCTHGATVGELDQQQLFYLRARGLDPAEAHGILTYGYANEIVESIGIEPLQVQLEALIRARVRASHSPVVADGD